VPDFIGANGGTEVIAKSAWALRISALALASAIGAADAKEKNEAAAMGAGITTCAEFAKAYQKDPDYVEQLFFTWAQGYFSGRNLEQLARGESQNLNSIPLERQRAILRRYCNDHPLAYFVDAADNLFTQFSKNSPAGVKIGPGSE
jgi:hypothetical protein